MLSNRLSVVFLLTLWCWAGSGLGAQPAQLDFRHYTTDDGLPSSQTYVVFEDRDGYLWVGTDNGVARFDGYEFKVYDADDGLEDTVVFSVVQDKEGTIWVGTISGKLYYLKGQQFYPFEHNHVILDTLRADRFIQLIDVDDQGRKVYSARAYRTMGRVDTAGQLELFDTDEPCVVYAYPTVHRQTGAYRPVAHTVVVKILNWCKGEPLKFSLWKDGRWVDTATMPPGKFGTKVGTFYFATSWEGNGKQQQAYLTSSKLIWIVEGESRIVSFKQEKYLGRTFALPTKEFGRIWVLEDRGGGLKEVTFGDDNEVTIRQQLSGHSLSSAAYDRNGGLWITSLDDGIFYAPFPDQKVYTRPDVTKNTATTSLAITGDNGLYAGYDDGSIFRLDWQTRDFFQVAHPTDSTGQPLFDLYYDSLQQRVYTPSFSFAHPLADPTNVRRRDAQFYASRNGQGVIVRRFNYSPYTTPDRLYFTSQGTGGVIKLGQPGTAELFSREDNQEFVSVADVCGDYNNHVAIGNLSGVHYYDEATQELFTPANAPSPLRERVDRIRQIRNGAMLYGTRGSGVVYHTADTVFTIRESDGLASDNIRNLYEDGDGNVWVATLNGLTALTFGADHGYRLRTFRRANGLPSEEVFVMEAADNGLWLVTGAGLVNYKVPPRDSLSPQPVIRSIVVDQEVYPDLGRVDLPAGIHDLAISFSTINFRVGDEVRYRYRSRTDQTWQYTTERTVNYPNLTAGSYVFAVESQNQDGVWSDTVRVPIYIPTPWYQRWWAIMLGLLVVIGSIVGYFIIRDRRRRREQDLLLQINQLEHAALHAQMNPHFVFNALNSIQNFVLQNDARQAATYLSRFAQVIRQTLRSSVDGRHALAREIDMLRTYLLLEKLRFKDGFNYEITVADDLPQEQIVLPPLLIQPFVENAIIHGLKGSAAGGKISVDFAGSPKLLRVTVEDNGVGFDTAVTKSAESLGMSITKRRLSMLNDRSLRTSSMKVIPLTDAEGQLCGTRVVLLIRPLTDRSPGKKVTTTT